MTLEWYEDLAERLSDAHDEALFSGDPVSAEAFTKAITAAHERARRLRNEYRAEQLHPVLPAGLDEAASAGLSEDDSAGLAALVSPPLVGNVRVEARVDETDRSAAVRLVDVL